MAWTLRIGLPLLLAAIAFADVKLPFILTDHMVVQRDMPVHIWGTAAPNEPVSVTFRNQTRSTRTDRLGRWSVYLPPGAAGGPFDLAIKGTNTITLRDVMVGDVWVAAGQSNMEWPVRWSADPQKEMAAAKYPAIRLVRTMHRVAGNPQSQFYGQAWQPCTPDSVKNFSAVGYHFGRNLHERLRVPIGIIQTAWGGTPLEAWTPLGAISLDPGLMPIFSEWAKLMRKHETNALELPGRIRDWEAGAPQRSERPQLRRRPGGQWTPAGLFNAMVSPVTKLAIRGVIWYQGEANTAPERAPIYGRLFQTMIRGWRTAWGQGSFPLLFVQLANYKAVPDSMWPEVREAQREALALANTAMAVTIDIGNPDDIHPRNKRDVGYRLSLAARAIAYGEELEYSGPLLRQAAREGKAVRLWFDHATSGLVLKAESGFEIAGADGQFVPAAARTDGQSIVVSSPAIENPVHVRYAWKDDPPSTLYNREGLPASPFRWDSL
jgi:sialate O-acetylesterase